MGWKTSPTELITRSVSGSQSQGLYSLRETMKKNRTTTPVTCHLEETLPNGLRVAVCKDDAGRCFVDYETIALWLRISPTKARHAAFGHTTCVFRDRAHMLVDELRGWLGECASGLELGGLVRVVADLCADLDTRGERVPAQASKAPKEPVKRNKRVRVDEQAPLRLDPSGQQYVIDWIRVCDCKLELLRGSDGLWVRVFDVVELAGANPMAEVLRLKSRVVRREKLLAKRKERARLAAIPVRSLPLPRTPSTRRLLQTEIRTRKIYGMTLAWFVHIESLTPWVSEMMERAEPEKRRAFERLLYLEDLILKREPPRV